MAVLDKPNEALNQYFCSEQITDTCGFVHSNQLKIVNVQIEEISEAESEWGSESYSDDYSQSSINEAAEFLHLSDVAKLVNQNNDLAESDVMSESFCEDETNDFFSCADRKGVLVDH